ncbi:hypothetical protein CT0861_02656, partial [Colletotrichum tofieldiae]
LYTTQSAIQNPTSPAATPSLEYNQPCVNNTTICTGRASGHGLACYRGERKRKRSLGATFKARRYKRLWFTKTALGGRLAFMGEIGVTILGPCCGRCSAILNKT